MNAQNGRSETMPVHARIPPGPWTSHPEPAKSPPPLARATGGTAGHAPQLHQPCRTRHPEHHRRNTLQTDRGAGLFASRSFHRSGWIRQCAAPVRFSRAGDGLPAAPSARLACRGIGAPSLTDGFTTCLPPFRAAKRGQSPAGGGAKRNPRSGKRRIKPGTGGRTGVWNLPPVPGLKRVAP